MKKAMAAQFMLVSLFLITHGIYAGSIPVANHSFESPYTNYVIPVVDDWIELDMDTSGKSQNTGVFFNSTNIANADANQIGFLGGESGNALLQDLEATYEVGKSYRMTVGVCVSEQFPPYDPNGLKLSFYHTNPSDPNRIEILAAFTGPPSTFTLKVLEDKTVYLPAVQPSDIWAGKTIGIAISATGPMGGYWDLDNVRVTEYPLVPNFTDDLFVNFEDFAIMAADWLACEDPFTDVTGEGCVDEQDLLILAEYWLDDV